MPLRAGVGSYYTKFLYANPLAEFGHQMLRIEPSAYESVAYVQMFHIWLCDTLRLFSLQQPLTFPIWKSEATASLMLDKKGKR